jgi:hypothetical protein
VLVRIAAEAGGYRVPEDVEDGRFQVALSLDHAGPEALRDEGAVAAVALVEALGVDAVQSLHPVGEVGAAALEDEVVVGAHQAVGVAGPAVAGDRLRQEVEKDQAVFVVEPEALTEHGADRDVEVAVR